MILGGALAYSEQSNLFTVAQRLQQMENDIQRHTSQEHIQELKQKYGHVQDDDVREYSLSHPKSPFSL